ncbi:MAG: sigma 54-interacting transcriptional regulator, partial [Planctomycetota bacterium]
INSRLPLESLLTLIVDKAILLCNAGRGLLVLSEPGGPRLHVARAAGTTSLSGGLELLSATVLERLLQNKEPLLVESVGDHPSLSTRRSVLESGADSILAMPLKRQDTFLGFLYLDAPVGTTRFSPSDLEILSIFAVQATIAMETAELLEENARQKSALEEANLRLSAQVNTQYREIGDLRSNLETLKGRQSPQGGHRRIIGQSPRLKQCLTVMERVADTTLNVILEGESGTGKELFAQALHTTSSRRSQAFVGENIAAIPRDLMESVLFGHVQGAFTGAVADKAGLFTLAHKGTLFLDEIGEMPPEMQASLLRVLQEGEVRPVGSPQNVKIDVRVIVATHRRLREEVEAGRFRADLWHRLNGITLEIPALRDREGDVDILVSHFLRSHPGIIPEVETLAKLRRLPWPGNVRQLRNEVERWAALGLTRVKPTDLSPDLGGPAAPIISGLSWQGRPLKDVVQEAADLVEREVISAVLEKHRGRKAPTARELDISRPTLDTKIRKLGLGDPVDPDEPAPLPSA